MRSRAWRSTYSAVTSWPSMVWTLTSPSARSARSVSSKLSAGTRILRSPGSRSRRGARDEPAVRGRDLDRLREAVLEGVGRNHQADRRGPDDPLVGLHEPGLSRASEHRPGIGARHRTTRRSRRAGRAATRGRGFVRREAGEPPACRPPPRDARERERRRRGGRDRAPSASERERGATTPRLCLATSRLDQVVPYELQVPDPCLHDQLPCSLAPGGRSRVVASRFSPRLTLARAVSSVHRRASATSR